VYTDSYYSAAGLEELFKEAHDHQIATVDKTEHQRNLWAEVVGRVVIFLPEPERLFNGQTVWIDIGCGAGGLVCTASEFGFSAIGVDLRVSAVEQLRALGQTAFVGDIESVPTDEPVDVISMMDVLEHIAFPHSALAHAFARLKPGGILLISCPNSDCATWRVMDQARNNPYWNELEHHHNFSRHLLAQLLQASGFEPFAYNISSRYKASMELMARKPLQ
jgi:2-polyprenyl-3-methyl-5-hydroxy-6-metoxy-1,4-benzoquinol methylase